MLNGDTPGLLPDLFTTWGWVQGVTKLQMPVFFYFKLCPMILLGVIYPHDPSRKLIDLYTIELNS